MLGAIIKPEMYPGSLVQVLKNYSSFFYSYNGEYWFLFPYSVLAILSPWIISLFNRFHYLIPLIGTFLIYVCTSFIISRYGAKFLFNNMWLYNPLLVFHMLFYFTLGLTCARINFWGILDKLKPANGILWAALIVLVIVFCFIDNFATHIVYVIAFIVLFVAAPKYKKVKSFFMYLGHHSMNMWLIHTWFCYYLFKDFIYGFKYPIIIFCVLVICTLSTSIIINWLTKPIEKQIIK